MFFTLDPACFVAAVHSGQLRHLQVEKQSCLERLEHSDDVDKCKKLLLPDSITEDLQSFIFRFNSAFNRIFYDTIWKLTLSHEGLEQLWIQELVGVFNVVTKLN